MSVVVCRDCDSIADLISSIRLDEKKKVVLLKCPKCGTPWQVILKSSWSYYYAVQSHKKALEEKLSSNNDG